MEDIIYGYQFNKEILKGYYKVEFFDDDGRCKNHWLSNNQIQYFKNRNDCVKYIKQVKEWNVFKFTQVLITKIN